MSISIELVKINAEFYFQKKISTRQRDKVQAKICQPPTSLIDTAKYWAILAALLFCHIPPVQGDVVSDWNNHALRLTYNARMQNFGEIATVFSLTNWAMFEAANSVERKYESFVIDEHPSSAIDADVAVIAAAHSVLARLFPNQLAQLANARAFSLSAYRNDKKKEDGLRYGEKVAASIFLARTDVLITPADSWRPQTAVGEYVPTTRLVQSYLGNSPPWLLRTGSQFRPVAPPALEGKVFAESYNEVRNLGRRTSSIRTPDMALAARFWTMSGVQVWNRALIQAVAQSPMQLSDHARLGALLNFAIADSYIAAWDAKFHYRLWRPITAIRNGDRINNPGLSRDATWIPLIETPLHPEYPSGHSANAGAAIAVLQSYFGKGRHIDLKITNDDFPGVARDFSSLEEMANEITASRIFGGIHFRFSCAVGEALGKEIGEFAVAKFLRKIDVAEKNEGLGVK